MASLWGELRRRNVFKVGAAYVVVAWLLIQVADIVLPTFSAPEWVDQTFTFLLILGFPVAVILAWAYEATPQGIKRTKHVPLAESIRHVTGQKLNYMITGLVVLVLGFIVVDQYLLEEQVQEETSAAVEMATVVSTVEESKPDVLPNSVAVLPFANLSPDPDNAYFAAGIHESIISQLARLSNLSVIARTSVMQYADSPPPVPEIASKLRVETVMEGSVRYAGDRVLVTAQLIDGVTGTHLWVDEYEADLSDVFGIQSDISMNIANALEAEFSLSEQESIEKIPTQSPAAYAFYLRALTLNASPDDESFRSALNQAIALDPEFALAYARRAAINTLNLVGVGPTGLAPDEALELERKVYEDAERALLIDPTLGAAHAALAAVHQANWRGTAAEQAFQRAIELSPNDVDVVVLYGRFKRYRGEYEEAIRLKQRAIELDPNVPYPRAQLAITYRYAADWDAAAAALQDVLNQDPASLVYNVQLAYVEASRGNPAEAVRLLQLAEQLGPSPLIRLAQMAHAYALAGRPDDAMRLFAEFEERATEEGVGEGWWAHAYIAVGDYGQALQRIESAVNERVSADQAALATLAANPWGDPELDKPEFRALLSKLWNDE